MNYHDAYWIYDRLTEHYKEALTLYPEERIVGIFLQGSQNYGLDTEASDVDTKLIITPSLDDIVVNNPPVSTTHIRENDEHIDIKDIRLYIDTFKKQNVNFVEILFTDYYYLPNDDYAEKWRKLTEVREDIARYDTQRALKAMVGVALEKYHAMEHRYPSKIDIIDKYGYDPKQLHHMLRIEDFLTRYLAGEPYWSCLEPATVNREMYLRKVKDGYYDLEKAREVADDCLARIKRMEREALEENNFTINKKALDVMNEVQYDIVRLSIVKELVS